jgi:hypothetical protein
LQIRMAEKPDRLNNARFELQRALRTRLEALEADDMAWFRSLICPSGKQGFAELMNKQLPALAAEVH